MRGSLIFGLVLLLAACQTTAGDRATSAASDAQVKQAAKSTQPWRPSEIQKSAVLDATTAYFAALDQEDFSTAFNMLAPLVRGRTSLQQFADLRRRLDDLQGAVIARTVKGVSWYPKGSKEGTGVAAAVDYFAALPGGNQVCGYLAFIELAPNEFVILRDDATFAEREKLAGMSAAERKAFLDRPGCRHLLDQT